MIIDKIKEIVKLYPDRVAYTVDNESITYENLWNNATKYSKFLKNEGTSPIIIYGNKEINMIISILSCLLAKRAYPTIKNAKGGINPCFRILRPTHIRLG